MKFRSSFLIAALALGACGGGGSSGSGGGISVSGGSGTGGGTVGGGVATGAGGGFNLDTGIGGSGGIIGDIDGFGSIILNGLELETDSAVFYIEGDSDGSQADLREGYYVIVAGDVGGLIAEAVVYRANLKGPMSADPVAVDPLAGEYEFTVLGQTVRTSASTRFDGVIAENIVQGNLLEISGPIDAAGRVLATYVELESSLSEYKAIGAITDLDSTAMTFNLAGLLVDYGSASLSEFEGDPLSDGQFVEIRLETTSFPAAGAVEVTEVELLPRPQVQEGAEIEIEGLIDSFNSATDFTVGGFPVTTDGSTTYEDGTATQLGLNVKVEVEGVVNSAGVIVADEVEIEVKNPIRVEGAVTGVDVTANTVTAMGITFQISAGTELEDDRDGEEPFSLNQLMAGDFVEIRGYLNGETVVAVELEREEDPDAGEFNTLLRGPLTDFSESAGTVEIQGVTVVELDGLTDYEDEDEESISRTAFFNLLESGQDVKAEWDDFGSFSDPADSLSLEEDDD